MKSLELPESAGAEIAFGSRTVAWYKWAAWFSQQIVAGRTMRHLQTPEQAFAILCKGDEIGLPPFAAWSWIYQTQAGRLSIQSKGALAVVQSKPSFAGYREWIEHEGQPTMTGCAEATRKGFPPVLKTFSLADAQTAGLLRERKNREGQSYDSTYQSYLKDMLLARARARALDIAFAAELGGIAIEGSAEDADMMEERRNPPPRQQRALQAPVQGGDPILTELGLRPAPRELGPGGPADGPGLPQGPTEEPGTAPDPPEPDPAAQAVAEAVREKVRDDVRRAVEEPSPFQKALKQLDKGGPPPAQQPNPANHGDAPSAGRRGPAREGAKSRAQAPPPLECERCQAPLNAMGGCDACGWPSEDDLR